MKKIKILKKNCIDITPKFEHTDTDIFVTKEKIITEYQEEGQVEIKKRTTEKVNLTRKINETAKAVKIQNTNQALEEIKKTFTEIKE